MDFSTYRSIFPITAEYAFLNHASISPYSTRVTQAIAAHTQAMQAQPFDHLRNYLLDLVNRVKLQVAQLINAASPDEIVPMPNTAMGINTAAASLPLQPGDNVLVLDGDYPANIYPWLNLAPRGMLVKWVPQQNGGLDLDRLVARIDRCTRAIALSSAMFATGFKNDLESVGALCQERGIYFVVDAIQTLGAFPVDVQACHIDFLACGSQKWMLSAPGSGFLYCRREVLDDLQLGAYVGAASTVDPFNFLDYNFTLPPSAERFSLGTPNMLGLVALDAALALLHEAGITHIQEHVLALTDMVIDDLQARGYHILSNKEPAHRSGILIVEVPDAQAAYERLLAANVVTSVRGAGLRIAPHFYNTAMDVLRVGEVLGDRTAA
jgi:selenocysteine lyase/cysteine desulfurase